MIKKILLGTFLIALAAFPLKPLIQTVQAANPSILLTWDSSAYVPPGFAGKNMPTANSMITAAAELIDNGKIIDVSRQNVYWYQNNNFIDGGIGKQRISFRAPGIAGSTISLRVEFPEYSKGSQLKTADIQVVRPEVVIESPFPGGKFSSSPLSLIGQPYFFNIASLSQLNFSWNVNGQPPQGAENPQILNVKFGQLPSQTNMAISLSAQNTDKRYQFETASENLTLTYSQ